MRVVKTVRLRLRTLLRGNRVDEELRDELLDHMARSIERHQAAGLTAAEARALATREFGNVPLVQEQCRDTRGVGRVEDMWRDLSYAVRSLRRAPGSTAVAALSLAAAIGANTASFSLVNMLMLRDLPVTDPVGLVELVRDTPQGLGSFSYPLYERVRDQNTTFSAVIAVSSPTMRIDDEGEDEPRLGRYVSGNFFETLGIQPAHGRLLTTRDDQGGNQPLVAVISHGLWQRAFGGDRDVVGKTIGPAGIPGRPAVTFTIVGVLPRSFVGLTVGRSDDFYLPLASEPRLNPKSLLRMPSAGWLKVVGRLKPGVSHEEARAGVAVIHARHLRDTAPFASEAEVQRRLAEPLTVESARAGLSGPRREFERPVTLMMGAVGLVLLIACANVVNLLLARGVARRAEIGVRLAIGASRGRLVRQLLVESAMLGLLGGGAGLALAIWGTRRLGTLMANGDPAVAYDVAPDGTVLMFTAVVSLMAALMAGIMPALRLSHTGLPSALGHGTAQQRIGIGAWTRGLIASQVALSLLLLAGALLLVTTLRNFRTGDFGFDRDNVLTMRVQPAPDVAVERRVVSFRGALERVREAPGVRYAALSLGMPVIGAGINSTFYAEGLPRDPDALAYVNDVTEGYFAATGTRLLHGRDFGPQDGPGSPPVAIVNDAVVQRFFPGRNPIGQRVNIGIRGLREIVGVVETTKYESLRETESPIVYTPIFQGAAPGSLNLTLKTESDAATMASHVRGVVGDGATVRVAGVETLSALIDRTLVKERLIARVLTAFAGLALVLAASGVYGVLAYAVSRRASEIGLRLALGATRRAVLWPVLSESLRLVMLGVALGVPAALAITRLLSSLLYGVTPTDIRVLGGVVLSMIVVALFAGAMPALRASRVDPLVALRYE